MTSLVRTTGAAFLLSCTTGWAGVTAQDVWNSFETSFDLIGEFDAELRKTGSSLSITQIRLKVPHFAEAKMAGTITLQETSDGRVEILLPPTIVSTFTSETGTSGTLNFSQTDMTFFASGSAGAIQYTLAAPEVGFDASILPRDGGSSAEIQIDLENFEGASLFTEGDMLEVDLDYKIETLRIDAALPTPQSPDMTLKSESKEIVFAALGKIPSGFEQPPMNAFFDPDIDFEITLEQGSSFSETVATISGQPTRSQTIVNSGRGELIFKDNAAKVEFRLQDLTSPIEINNLPLPMVSSKADEVFVSLQVPLSTSENQPDFTYKINVNGLTVDDALWGIFDPQAIISRDPLNLRLDLTGSGNFALDQLTLPDDMQSLIGEDVFETMRINAFSLDVAGAALDATGSFVFDHTDKQPGTPPRVDGKLNVDVSGGFSLLDNLATLGFLSEQQAIGLKFASGFFLTPGPAPDSLKSLVEIKPDGSIYANGQQVK